MAWLNSSYGASEKRTPTLKYRGASYEPCDGMAYVWCIVLVEGCCIAWSPLGPCEVPSCGGTLGNPLCHCKKNPNTRREFRYLLKTIMTTFISPLNCIWTTQIVTKLKHCRNAVLTTWQQNVPFALLVDMLQGLKGLLAFQVDIVLDNLQYILTSISLCSLLWIASPWPRNCKQSHVLRNIARGFV